MIWAQPCASRLASDDRQKKKKKKTLVRQHYLLVMENATNEKREGKNRLGKKWFALQLDDNLASEPPRAFRALLWTSTKGQIRRKIREQK
jgi:hypothetical protein